MLHILWLILKFILILLGIVLGLLLLAILLILFCPVRYRASGTKEQDDWKKIRGEGQISWLFHGVVLRVVWAEGNLQTSFRLFGIPVVKILNRRKKVKDYAGSEEIPEKPVNVKSEKMISSPVDSQPQDAPEKSQQKTDSDKKEKKISPVRKLLSGIQSKRKRIWDRIHHIRAALCRVGAQVTWWRDFLEHPRVQAGISLVWTHAKFLICHVLPTGMDGEITFSTEDPSITGAILAVLGMTIPFHKNCVRVRPLFSGENYCQGNVRIKGRIYGIVFVRAAVSIYFNKNIKYVIRRWKTRRA
ncbi:DUF2953 domain-containing protein [Blautia sp. HCP3S3_C12]|uniref:DUF2953 domain-containing protein n=1 Tax=unclassified Blautia TaxID=2648079 RepID=UPI003F893987